MRCARCDAKLVPGALRGLCPACLLDAAVAEEETEPAGEFHYDLIEEIGRGGMGVVFRAIQHGSHRQVAVKMILAEQAATPGMMDRFRSEVEAVASLDHPNILPVYETGDAEGTLFYSMKYANGGTLRDMIPKFRRQPREAAAILATIARAVHHAHERGILHRDLKPGNILLDDTANTPYVSDFGLAKWLGRDSRLTIAPSALGTPHYISPEQAKGASAELTTATDVYSLGAILYELLSGQPPFIADTPFQTLRLVTEVPPPPPRSLEASVPRDLEVICLKCLAKEPEARYRSSAALAEDLEHWLEGRSITAQPSRPLERLWRWTKRNPAFAALAALSLALLLAFAIGSPIAAARIARSRDRAVSAEKEATEKLYGSYLAQARASRLTGHAGQRIDALAAISQAARIHPSLDLRNEAIAALALFDVRIGRTWKRLPAPNLQLAFDEQLQRYACEGENGSVEIRSVIDQRELLRLVGPGGRPEFIYAFSPTGEYLVAKFTNGQTCLWHLPNPKPVLVLQGNPVNGFGWSALSSQFLAFSLPGGGVDVYRLEEVANLSSPSLARPWRHWPEPGQTQGLAFDPSGTKLAISDVADGDVAPEKRRRIGGVKVREVESGNVLWDSPVAAGVGTALWSSDGRLLAAASWDKAVHILDASNGAQLRLLQGHRDGVTLARFNHRGSRLASISLDGFMIFWDAWSGEDLVRLPVEDLTYLFAPDDGRMGLAFSEDTIGLLEIEDTRVFQAWRPLNSPGRPLGFAVSPDGNFLASTGFTGVEIWDAANSRLALSAPTTEVRVSTVAFLDHKQGALSLLIGNDGDGYARQIVRFDRAADPPRPELETPTPWLQEAGWLVESISPDGSRVALSTRDAKRPAIIAALADSSSRIELTGQGGTHGVVFSHDGRLVAGGSRAQDGVAVWRSDTGELIRKLEKNVDASAAFDPANRWLVTATANGYRFWSVPDWRPGPHLEMSDLKSWAAAFSPDGRYLAALEAGGQVGIFDVATAERLAALEPPFSVAPGFIAFSEDGRWLNVLGIDQTIQRWDLLALREELQRYGLGW